MLGPALWGITLFIFDPAGSFGKAGYQIAIGTLLVLVLVGFVLHQRVPMTNRRERGAEYNKAEAPTGNL